MTFLDKNHFIDIIEEENEDKKTHDKRKSQSLNNLDEKQEDSPQKSPHSIRNSAMLYDYSSTDDESTSEKQKNNKRYQTAIIKKTESNSPNHVQSKQASSLIQEFQRKFVTNGNENKRLSGQSQVSEFDSPQKSKSGDSRIKDMSYLLGDLKSNITDIEIELHRVKKDIKDVKDKVLIKGSQHEDNSQSIHHIEALKIKTTQVLNEAIKAKENFDTLKNECNKLKSELINQLKNSKERTQSSPDLFASVCYSSSMFREPKSDV